MLNVNIQLHKAAGPVMNLCKQFVQKDYTQSLHVFTTYFGMDGYFYLLFCLR